METISLTSDELFNIQKVIDKWHRSLDWQDANTKANLADASKFDAIYRKITTELRKRGEIDY